MSNKPIAFFITDLPDPQETPLPYLQNATMWKGSVPALKHFPIQPHTFLVD